MSEALDTHNYDGKWEEELKEVNEKYEQFIKKYNAFTAEMGEIDIIALSTSDNVMKNQAVVWRNTILAGNAADPANNVCPGEILQKIEKCMHIRICLAGLAKNICELYSVANSSVIDEMNSANVSMINSYVEQLADISNGSCIQGQTTRLFQIFSALL